MKLHASPILGVIAALPGLGCSDDAPSAPSVGQPSSGIAFSSVSIQDPVVVPQTVALWGEAVDNPSRPMVAGTLSVTPDGAFALASDSERDVIYVVDLAARKPQRIGLEPGDEPGRIVSGRTTGTTRHAYAVLRRKNALLDLDLNSAEMQRVPTCSAPRGLAYDEDAQVVHVACASGELVTHDVEDWSERRRSFVAADLKDVELSGENLVLSRYMSAELLVLDEAGDVVSRATPAASPECGEATVASRLAVRGNDVYLAHQLASSRQVGGVDSTCTTPTVASLLTKEPLAQLGQAPTSPWQTLSMVSPAEGAQLEVIGEAASFAAGFVGSSGPLDFAVGANGRSVISLAGNYWVDELATVVTLEPDVEGDAGWLRTVRSFRPAGMLTSVAFDKDVKWVAFSREPAALYFEEQNPIFLGGTSVNSSAFSLLHMNAGGGISCISCHPEGGRDDHRWGFSYGARLTLPLRGARAPYNWDHLAADVAALLPSVLYEQMKYPLAVTQEQASLLQAWLSDLPVDDTAFGASSAAQRGRALFESSEVGCAGCHTGPTYSDPTTHDVDTGGAFATPTLLGLASRTTFLHDGCAASLEEVFGFCGGTHQSVQNLKREQVEDLLAFLTSL
jgi:hypothetical protein